jgi:tRNA(Ile2) C34 agmatinyltransferase TiaS
MVRDRTKDHRKGTGVAPAADAPPPRAVPPCHCPRCRGRLFAAGDEWGTYRSCFTCGYVAEQTAAYARDGAPTATGAGQAPRQHPSHHARPL